MDSNQIIEELKKKLDEANRKVKEYEEIAQKASKASQMKTIFLANMSHEIRTPLNAVTGFARIIAETDSAAERKKFLSIIEGSSQHLQMLVNEILDLSRVEQGEIKVNNIIFDVNDLIRDVKDIFHFRCPDEIKMIITHPENGLKIEADRNRVMQVLSNFISNALKHTTKGSIEVGYQISSDRKTISFYVSDTGEGMTQYTVDHIFDLYYSEDAERKEDKKGFGLGMTLCKSLAEKMNGTINLKTALGKGSTFYLNLPFTEVKNAATPTVTQTSMVSDKPTGEKKHVILVAEDIDTNFELVNIILRKFYTLLRAHDGVEAVQMNEEHKPDLILMDMMMPNMDGYDATRIIREVNPKLPILALSAYAFETDVQKAKDVGCTDFISKPVNMVELKTKIKKYLSNG